MSSLTATGNNNPNYHPTEVLFDPRRGMSFRKRVTCGVLTSTSEASLLSILNTVQALGASGKIVLSNEIPVLEYELPGIPSDLTAVLSELYFDDWQMQIDDLTNTVFANSVLASNLNYNDLTFFQRYAKLGSGTGATDIVTGLNNDLDAGVIAAPTAATGGTSTTPSRFQPPTPSDLSDEVFLMIDKDQTEFLDPLPVLHHTSCCSPGASYNSTRAYEMCIYSPAQLLTEVGSGWTCNLPGVLYSQISSFPVRTAPAAEAAFWTWGWLKTRAIQRTQTNFSVERH